MERQHLKVQITPTRRPYNGTAFIVVKTSIAVFQSPEVLFDPDVLTRDSGEFTSRAGEGLGLSVCLEGYRGTQAIRC